MLSKLALAVAVLALLVGVAAYVQATRPAECGAAYLVSCNQLTEDLNRQLERE